MDEGRIWMIRMLGVGWWGRMGGYLVCGGKGEVVENSCWNMGWGVGKVG